MELPVHQPRGVAADSAERRDASGLQAPWSARGMYCAYKASCAA